MLAYSLQQSDTSCDWILKRSAVNALFAEKQGFRNTHNTPETKRGHQKIIKLSIAWQPMSQRNKIVL